MLRVLVTSALLSAPAFAQADAGTTPSAAQRREDAWRKKFRDAHEKIATLQAQLDADTKELGDVTTVPGGARPGRSGRNMYTQLEKRIADTKKQLEKAKTALDDLERKASFDSVPREWRQ